tara:strand:+ start:831 stop:2003 length:1173 start_codon:yes stop_codon:yes gene_type:complete
MVPLQAAHPSWAPELREALRVRYAERWQQEREGVEPRIPGKKPVLSVPIEQIPKTWRLAIKEMEAARAQVDRGIMTLDDRTPPSAKVIANLKRTARQLVFAAIEADCKPALDMPCVRAFLAASKIRGTKPITRCSRLKELMVLACWLDEGDHADIFNAMRRKKNQLARLAQRQRKHKEEWLIHNPTEILDCWMLSEELLQEAMSMPSGCIARLDLALDALAIALAVNIPLRIGDLHRFQIGVHLSRSIERDTWTVDLRTAKTGSDYVAELWPELTPFLDAVVLVGRSEGSLGTRLRELNGQYLFAKYGRKLGAGWVSTAWRRHIGTGEHIVRTLWHEEALDDADTWIALVLCGQEGGGETARHYQVKQQKRQAGRRAKTLMRAARGRRRP